MTEQEKIENCYRQMYDGMIRKDSRLLSEVLDDSFVLIHMTGMRQSKKVFIRAVEDGTLNYYSTAHQEIKAEIHGETATLHGKKHCKCRCLWRRSPHLETVYPNGADS